MLSANLFSSRLMKAFFSIAMIAAFGVSVVAQEAPAVHVGYTRITGLPDDWTHHHVVFSNPGTEQQAIKKGTHEQWLRTTSDPRYVIQQLKKNMPVNGTSSDDVAFRRAWIAKGFTNADGLAPKDWSHTQRARKPGKKPAPTPSGLTKDWNQAVGVTAAPSPVASPAKWSWGTSTASCTSDFVIFPTAGSTSQASIIAYYNLYTGGCTGTVPQVDWAYNTGGTAALSPVLSYNGDQVAFIQTSSSIASLVLLRYPLTPPGTGTLAAPITPTTATSASNYLTRTNCATPCMFKIPLSGSPSPNDTWSNPYYDYNYDVLYVGDSVGKLHKFSPVFNGAPAEVTTGGWPVQLKQGGTNDTTPTASPVYDDASGYIFVGTTGGYLYSVGSGYAGTTSAAIHGYSGRLDATFGLRDAPLVDSAAGKVYVFAGNDTNGNNGIFQFATTFTTGSGTEAILTSGSGATGVTAYQFDGAFDNTYYTSSNGASPTGYIYACGTGNPATLYQVKITSNVMGTVTTGPTLGGAAGGTLYYGRCSPVSEFYNPSIAKTTANGTVTINSNPSGWASSGQTVTIGATTYTFVTALTGANQILAYTGSNANNNESRTAQNLRAVIDATASQCYTGGGCVYAGQAVNASVTATQATNVVTLTSKIAGSAGNFTLSTSSATNIPVSGGSNGTSGADYLFVSVFDGLPTGCTDSASYGCVMSFDVTNPASFGTGLTPGGTLNVSAPTTAAPTGGIIIDNSATNLSGGGTSQIYFVTQSTIGSTPCTGVCAVQDSQSAP